ncbi:MAG: 50S ribosomal protein L22 [Bacilli bacterium]
MAENEEKKVVKKTTAAKAKKPAAKKAVEKTETAAKPVAKKAEVKPVEEKKTLRTEACAELNNYGATPRKVRLVIDLIRGKNLAEAYAILDNCPKACSRDIKKLVMSAAANAVNNFKMDADTLYVATISANDALKLKRILPRAKGSASGLVKRWSHVYVTVKNREAK